jgi:hypothetical protein
VRKTGQVRAIFFGFFKEMKGASGYVGEFIALLKNLFRAVQDFLITRINFTLGGILK